MQSFFATKKIGSQLRKDLSWHLVKLILRHDAPGYRPAGWYQVRAPLENQSQIPDDENAERRAQ